MINKEQLKDMRNLVRKIIGDSYEDKEDIMDLIMATLTLIEDYEEKLIYADRLQDEIIVLKTNK